MAKKEKLSLEELLDQALVKDGDQPYEVPENWVWTRLEQINLRVSKILDPKFHPHEYFELYSVPSCEGDYPEILFGKEIGSTKQIVRKNDVLLCKINPRINRVWIVSKHTEFTNIASSEWIVVTTDKLNPKYVMWCLRSKYFREFMLSNVSGVGGSLTRSKPKDVCNYPIPIPPLLEQQRIVVLIESLFEKLDRAKELAQNVLDSFENRKSAILHKAVTGELTRKWREENKGNKWGNCVLNDIIMEKPRNGYSPSGVPYVTKYKNLSLSATTTGVFKGECFKYVDIDIADNSYLWLKNGDILIQRSNSLDYVGTCAIYDGQDNEYIYPDLMMKIQVNASFVITKFLYYFLSDIDTKKYFKDNATGTAGNMPKINQKTVMNTPILLPTLSEQKEIVRILDNLLENEQKAKELCDVIDKIDHMKKTILARAFRGELSTNNPDEENVLELLKEVLKEKE